MGDAGGIRAALQRLRTEAGLPVAFGGLSTDARQFRISDMTGTTSTVLRGLAIRTGTGLGGKAAVLGRPLSVTDYRSSHAITHEYDAAVAAEGLRSVLAVPVVVRGRVRGVLYGALRRPLALGDRSLTAAVGVARELEQNLAVQDEVGQLLSAGSGAVWEEVREAHGELRTLARRVTDPALREELLAACARLARASGTPSDAGAGARAGAATVALSPREVDVLTCVASGATNAGTAERLGLRPETVKSYLRSGMRKLGARTRLEAVVAARRAGVLP
ncbi:DNA-binding CsgD family transcriptional regulator [Streptomyces olivoverticillatus]|uniref:DNA-binding CsgD family transcriptional regulator n=1 Tax=Streptomyces olivoverticillatus TaxID=66427 RepID=A0A7W7PNH0_9ACTN|nr:helix-turn-helix transcriptional regulator [Streptomyces olivoverticillatus]MBB4895503.1 DNA-binding CsgD family transcriptional regulator [Streptomyces olivoverticillatus]